MKIKMCGLRRREDILFVNEVLPDYAGFILSRPFWRSISLPELEELTGLLDKRITPVGVFVDEAPRTVAGCLESGIIRAAQLHGHEDEAYLKGLRDMTKRPVIRAFRIKEKADAEAAERCSADMVLLDGGTGSGQTFDWSLLEAVHRPYILAGGLGPDNIEEALSRTSPWGVDVSSGIETDRCKDIAKMRLFAQKVRGR